MIEDQRKIVSFLEKRERIPSDTFLEKLELRKLEEIEHSDIIHSPKEITGVREDTVRQHARSRPVYSTNRAVRSFIDGWIKKHSKGKVVLDLACGAGELTLQAYLAGASVAIGTDLAPRTIESNRKLKGGDKNGLFYIIDDAENMCLPDECVDLVLCSGMLHHVELADVVKEINRVLKPGGKMLAIEALKYNPAFSIYRKLTPTARTHWEASHILGMSEVKYMNTILPVTKVKYWQLFSIFAAFVPHKWRFPVLDFMELLDRIVLKIPYINRMAWIFTIEAEK